MKLEVEFKPKWNLMYLPLVLWFLLQIGLLPWTPFKALQMTSMFSGVSSRRPLSLRKARNDSFFCKVSYCLLWHYFSCISIWFLNAINCLVSSLCLLSKSSFSLLLSSSSWNIFTRSFSKSMFTINQGMRSRSSAFCFWSNRNFGLFLLPSFIRNWNLRVFS